MISPSDPIAAIRREHHSESPIFWVIVFAGSLLIHLLLVLGMRSLVVQIPVDPEPITVEFAEATDAASSPASAAGNPSPRPAAPSTPTAVPSPIAKSIADPTETSSPRLQPPSSDSEPSLSTPAPVPPVQPSPQAKSPSQSPAPSPSAPVSSPTPATPVPNRVSPTEPVTSPAQTRPSNSMMTGPIASGIRLPDVPTVPNPADNPGATTQPSKLPINPLAISKVPIPAKFLAQVQILPETGKGGSDRAAEVPAAAIQGEPSKEFLSDASNCLLSPAALSAFGQAVVLSVSLNEHGQLQGEPAILDPTSSGNSRYDDLAVCVLKQWTFSPAYDQTDDHNRVSKPTTIQVQVKITE